MLPYSISFEAIGTSWRIDADIPLPLDIVKLIHEKVDFFDKTYSRFRTDSLVHAISLKAGSYSFPDDAVQLFDMYEKLHELTDGKVTPLIGAALERAGYDAEYSFKPVKQVALPPLYDAIRINGADMHTTQPVMLDFGAAGKGYLIDLIASILDDNLIEDYVIDGSGDIRHSGHTVNRVGLEHPLQNGTIIGAVDVKNASICASASNRRAWGEGMHHIFDPTSLRPVSDTIATWVVAEDALQADGISTALFFVNAKKLEADFKFKYVRMFSDFSVEYSQNFTGEIY